MFQQAIEIITSKLKILSEGFARIGFTNPTALSSLLVLSPIMNAGSVLLISSREGIGEGVVVNVCRYSSVPWL